MKQHIECLNYSTVKGKGIILLWFVLLFAIVYFLALQQLLPHREILRAYQALPKYLENSITNYLGITIVTRKIQVETGKVLKAICFSSCSCVFVSQQHLSWCYHKIFQWENYVTATITLLSVKYLIFMRNKLLDFINNFFSLQFQYSKKLLRK